MKTKFETLTKNRPNKMKRIIVLSHNNFDLLEYQNIEIYMLILNHFFFLSTPTVLPLLPVVFVCCPLTFSPHLCLKPLLDLILKSLSTSSLSFVYKTLDAIWRFLPSL